MSLNKNSVAVVTGAASGIGRALALRLAQEKIAGIAIADVNEAGLQETQAMVEKTGVPVSAHIVDVSKLDQIQKLADDSLAKHGRVTHLINNAGVALIGNAEELSFEDIEWLMGINFWGTVYGTKVFLPILRRQEQGHVINISSIFGIIAPPGQSAYCASKFAVRGFTESLRHELEGSNVLISSVHPGGIKTNICNDSRIGENATDEDKKLVRKFFDKASPTTADQAAEIIVTGIKNKNPRILVGSDAKQIDKIQRWFPRKYFSVMNRLSGGKLEAMMKKK
ncbi:MAG TPA: SDR family NAD(P)-dependent oxidoreductase [Pyrinomonadaceae bacterium]|jgi:short-subunit dehydrogenase|nr:SDR family NAD(P)-dependent oxidoreductase [Pyrinomonadaceae bacterium]